MKIDYTQEIKDLILNNYDPVISQSDESEYTVKKSLTEMHKDIAGVLPSLWIDESDVYESLQELGFKSFLSSEDDVMDFEKDEVLVPGKTLLLYFLDKKTANY